MIVTGGMPSATRIASTNWEFSCRGTSTLRISWPHHFELTEFSSEIIEAVHSSARNWSATACCSTVAAVGFLLPGVFFSLRALLLMAVSRPCNFLRAENLVASTRFFCENQSGTFPPSLSLKQAVLNAHTHDLHQHPLTSKYSPGLTRGAGAPKRCR